VGEFPELGLKRDGLAVKSGPSWREPFKR